MSLDLPVKVLNKIWTCKFPDLVADVWIGRIEEDALTDVNKLQGHLETRLNFSLPTGLITDVSSRGELKEEYVFFDKGLVLPIPPRPGNAGVVFLNYQGRMGEKHRMIHSMPGTSFELTNILAGQLRAAGTGTFDDNGIVSRIKDELKGKGATWTLSGEEIDLIQTALLKYIVHLWLSESEYDELDNDRGSFNQRFVNYFDTQIEGRSWPDDQFMVSISDEMKEPTIVQGGMQLSFPTRPTLEAMFRAWADGEAAIPTFSVCYKTPC